jgi:hypothetical protein
VRFRTPNDREAAMRRQPFELDGATVKLVREGETDDVIQSQDNYMAHVPLRDYPVEQRTEVGIATNCVRLGFMCEIDPAFFAAPDLATVHVVLQLQDPREIPHQVRIRYCHGVYTSVVPVRIFFTIKFRSVVVKKPALTSYVKKSLLLNSDRWWSLVKKPLLSFVRQKKRKLFVREEKPDLSSPYHVKYESKWILYVVRLKKPDRLATTP